MDIVKKLSPNFSTGREGKAITHIVIHWVGEGTAESAATYFSKKTSQVSAHYIVGNNSMFQCVEDKDTAWHAGDWNMNLKSIGIEHEATPNLPPTETVYQNSGTLVAEIAKRHNIPLDRNHIIGHKEVVATQCPGSIDIDKIISIAKGEGVSEVEKLKEEVAYERSEKERYKKERNECRESRIKEGEEHAKAIVSANATIENYQTLNARLEREAIANAERMKLLEKVQVDFEEYKKLTVDEIIALNDKVTALTDELDKKDATIKKLKLPIKMLTFSDFIKIKFGK